MVVERGADLSWHLEGHERVSLRLNPEPPAYGRNWKPWPAGSITVLANNTVSLRRRYKMVRGYLKGGSLYLA